MTKKILVLGSGAREHSIIRAIERSSKPNEIFCVASNMNPGIANLCDEFIIDDFKIDDPSFVDNYYLFNSCYSVYMALGKMAGYILSIRYRFF